MFQPASRSDASAAARLQRRRMHWLGAVSAVAFATFAASCGEPASEQANAPAELACAGHVYATVAAWEAPEGAGSAAEAAPRPPGVTVIDMATNAIVASIPTSGAPINPTFRPNSNDLYVAQTGAGQVAIIDVRTNEITSQLRVGGQSPSGLAFTPDGLSLVVTLLGGSVQTPGHVQLVTLATGELGPLIPVGNQPERLALTPDGSRAYVANIGGGSVSVVDLTQGTVIATITTTAAPFNVLMSPEGDKVYVGAVRGNEIEVIDTATNAIAQRIAIPSPNGLAFSPDRQSIFVSNVFADQISVVSRADNTVVRSAAGGVRPGHLQLTADGSRAYMARPYGGAVAVIDTATLAEISTIDVGQAATTVAVCGAP